MTDYKGKYEELLQVNSILKEELDSFKLKSGVKIEHERVVFEKFAEMLPEMIYEVDLKGRVLYGNTQGLKFFGYSKEDIAKGLNISEVFPESFTKMIENLKDDQYNCLH